MDERWSRTACDVSHRGRARNLEGCDLVIHRLAGPQPHRAVRKMARTERVAVVGGHVLVLKAHERVSGESPEAQT